MTVPIPDEWAAYTDEARQAILDRLRTFGRVEWIGASAEIAFADSVLELMGYLNYRQRVMVGLPAEDSPVVGMPLNSHPATAEGDA